jgi:Flp pilus assembly protein TadG
MLHHKRASARRTGTAVVEMTLVMQFVLIPLLLGLWEMGRVVQVQQIVANATREGARMAAQAVTINQSGAATQIRTAIAPASNTARSPNVKAAVMQYLAGAGLTRLEWADVDVTFTFLDGNTASTEPYQGTKSQRFRVTVTITDLNSGGGFKAVRPLRTKCLWSTLGIVQPTTVGFTVEWRMMVDDPFAINTALPNW